MEDVGERVEEVVARLLNVDPARVTQGARFIEDLHATSLDVVEIIMALEERFSVEISDTDAEGIHTVGDVAALLVRKLA